MPLLKRRCILAAKQETTMGTAVSLSASDGVFNVLDAMITHDVPPNERMGQGSLSKLPSVPGARSGKVTCSIELAGSGSDVTPVPQWATTFLPACGWVNSSGVFSPTSSVSAMKTLTIGIYEDGLLKTIKGAMGTFSLEAETGKPARINFEFQGIFISPTDVTLITPDYPSVIPPRWASSTCTIGAFAPICSKLTIAANNQIHLREDPADISGYRAAVITDRFVKGSIDPEATLVASHDIWGTWLAGTEAAFSCNFGGTAGNVVTVAAPKLQYVGDGAADRGGVLTEDIAFQCNKSTDLGNDELTFTFA